MRRSVTGAPVSYPKLRLSGIKFERLPGNNPGNMGHYKGKYLLLPSFCNVRITIIMGEAINHQGIIERIEGHTVYVKVARQAACEGCQARSMCSAAGGKTLLVEATDSSGAFRVNESVVLSGQPSMGLQAVWLAFVVPLLLVVAAVVLGAALQWQESLSALGGLFLLFPYYILLYFLRDTLKKKFIFTIKKINL
jgi:sigma-E factor negative regulatory protein RseC